MIVAGGIYFDGHGGQWRCEKVLVENPFALMVPHPPRGHNEPHVRRWIDTNTGKWGPYPTGADMIVNVPSAHRPRERSVE